MEHQKIPDHAPVPRAHSCGLLPMRVHAVQDGHQAQHLTYRSALDAAQNMYRREGWRAFYNGLAPAWLGSGEARGVEPREGSPWARA